MTGGVDVSIIVVSWNTRDLLVQCLQSIAHDVQTLQHSAAETILVDNGSNDGSVAMVQEHFPWVHLSANAQNVGFARANNQAIRRSSGRYVLLLNSDAMLQKGSLTSLIDFADSHPDAGIVGPRLINADGTFQASLNDFPTLPSIIREAWGLAKLLSGNAYYPSYPPEKSLEPCSCDWVGGACLLARSRAIEQVGLLDEGFFMNSEEVDWCYRMHQAGWQVWYTPAVSVIHLGGASASRRGAIQRMRLYEGKARFLHKHHGALSAQVARSQLRTSSAGKAILYRLRYLMRRKSLDLQQAQAYWQVATQRKWV